MITVGSFHAGLKHNIIPDDARLQLTVRSYKDEVRKKLLAGIERVAKGEAVAAGAPREPEIRLSDFTPATYNDPTLTQRLVDRLKSELGADKLVEIPATMGGEDFSVYGRNGIPACMLNLGAVNPARYAAAKAAGEDLPSLHSPLFLPDLDPTLHAGIKSLTIMVRVTKREPKRTAALRVGPKMPQGFVARRSTCLNSTASRLALGHFRRNKLQAIWDKRH